MILAWKNEEIEHILKQLNDMNMPFEKYFFNVEDGHLCHLGSGAYAQVYEGHNNQGKKCAIKVIGFNDRISSTYDFFNNVSHQQTLSYISKNVVKVYDYVALTVRLDKDNNVVASQYIEVAEEGENENYGDMLLLHFIVMEKLEPVFYKDNKGNIKLNPFALEASSDQEIVKLAYNICMALQLAHRRNVLHRDIKLENIFYSPKKKMYKLGDFGIAKVTDKGVASTIAFTGGYGAPEVRDDLKDVYDERADIYSLGMTLYLLLNGRRFPDSKTYKPNLREQYTKGFVLPYPDNGPDKMRHIIRKMCMYDPNDRYQSIKEVMDDLEKLIYSPTLSYRIQHRNLLLIIGCVCMFLGLGAAVITYMPQVYTNDSTMIQQYTNYRWLAVTLLLLALFLLLQYYVIFFRYIALFNCILKWHLLEWVYMIYLVECGISGGLRNYVLTSPYSEAYIAYMYEHNDPRWIEFMLTMDFFNIAVVMLVFGAIWCIREKILIHIEDARQEDGIL